MTVNTSIGWTRNTWNPWRGCTRVSPGCDNCYMFTGQRRYGRDPEIVTRSKTTFRDPLRWTEPTLIFTCSWSDWFHKDADPWRDEAWDIIRQTPHHTYQILTKRPGRIPRHLPSDWGDGWPNVWLGTSIESQEYSYRARQLLDAPARLHFLSCEPLLGALDIMAYLAPAMRVSQGVPPEERQPLTDETVVALNQLGRAAARMYGGSAFIDWVIVGGESGAGHRDMFGEWMRDLVLQCRSAGVPIYVKQDSGPYPERQGRIPNEYWVKEMPTQ